MKILAIIPARGGSKGVPRKNIKPINNIPLIAYSIGSAQKAGEFLDRIVVSTEDAEIKSVAQKWGAEVIDRPQEYAEDTTPTEPVLAHAVKYLFEKEGYLPDAVMLLQATCPFRESEQIVEAVKKFASGNYDTLISLRHDWSYIYKIDENDLLIPQYLCRARRQDRNPIWVESGVIYITKTDLIRQGKIFGNKLGYIKIDGNANINIDEPTDFLVAETISCELTKLVS